MSSAGIAEGARVEALSLSSISFSRAFAGWDGRRRDLAGRPTLYGVLPHKFTLNGAARTGGLSGAGLAKKARHAIREAPNRRPR